MANQIKLPRNNNEIEHGFSTNPRNVSWLNNEKNQRISTSTSTPSPFKPSCGWQLLGGWAPQDHPWTPKNPWEKWKVLSINPPQIWVYNH